MSFPAQIRLSFCFKHNFPPIGLSARHPIAVKLSSAALPRPIRQTKRKTGSSTLADRDRERKEMKVH